MRNNHWKWVEQAITLAKDECILWPFRSVVEKRGGVYGRCTYGGAQILAHRLAFFFANKRWPTPCARHTCDVTLCINPRHIIEGTQQQNITDTVVRGRKPHGEAHCHAKITDALVRQIRAEYRPRVCGTLKLSRKYGLDRKNIYNIVTHRAWKHVV